MVETSWAWDNAFAPERTLVPETFVEISLGVVDTKATRDIEFSQFNNHSSSNVYNMVRASEIVTPTNWATFEENRWVLDGSKHVVENSDMIGNGFVSSFPDGNAPWVQFDLPEATTTVAPGITIVWDSENGGYPTSWAVVFCNEKGRFEIAVENGKVSKNYTVVDGSQAVPIVFEGIDNSTPYITRLLGSYSGYNMVFLTVLAWNTPNHRPRIDRFVFGRIWTFDKNDILSYTHEQSGDILGTELPKNSITFSVSNVDDKWNPNNPEGLGKYIVERQMLSVRYGVDTGVNAGNGTIRWIPAGTFYLSEWNAPANGMEATFTARDPFEFMMSTKYPGLVECTHRELIEYAFAESNFPGEFETNFKQYCNHTVIIPDDNVDEYGFAGFYISDLIQLCVNASGSVCWFDRDGVFQVKGIPYLKTIEKIYDIPMDLAYSHPEITMNKPTRFVEIDYNPVYDHSDGFERYHVDDEKITEGETLKINNDFIQSATNCNNVAAAAVVVLKHRKQVTGEFRANPKLDVFDWVNIHSKYGDMKMILTRIKYTYTGSFRAEYTAREMDYTEVSE